MVNSIIEIKVMKLQRKLKRFATKAKLIEHGVRSGYAIGSMQQVKKNRAIAYFIFKFYNNDLTWKVMTSIEVYDAYIKKLEGYKNV